MNSIVPGVAHSGLFQESITMNNQEARDELKSILHTIEEHTDQKKRLWDLFHKMKKPIVQERTITLIDHTAEELLRAELATCQSQLKCAECRANQNAIALANTQKPVEFDLNQVNPRIVQGILNLRPEQIDRLDQRWLAFTREVVGEPWASQFTLDHVKQTLHFASSELAFLRSMTLPSLSLPALRAAKKNDCRPIICIPRSPHEEHT